MNGFDDHLDNYGDPGPLVSPCCDDPDATCCAGTCHPCTCLCHPGACEGNEQ